MSELREAERAMLERVIADAYAKASGPDRIQRVCTLYLEARDAAVAQARRDALEEAAAWCEVQGIEVHWIAKHIRSLAERGGSSGS